MDEIGEARGWRLGAIIHNLRTKYHWPVLTDYRGPERIAHYRLSERADWRTLDFPPSAKPLREELKDGDQPAQAGATGTVASPNGRPHG